MSCKPSTSGHRRSVSDDSETRDSGDHTKIENIPMDINSSNLKRPPDDDDAVNEVIVKKPKTDNEPIDYRVTSGVKTTLHGTIYQLKLLMLFAMKGHNNKYKFRMATEMKAAEDFDDVAFKYNDPILGLTWRFLQVKHKLDAKIAAKDLLTTTSKNKDHFFLPKYIVSFCKIKDNDLFKDAEPKDFTLITNTDFDFMEKDELKEVEKKWNEYLEIENGLEEDTILGYNDFNAKKFRIKSNAKTDLKEIILQHLLQAEAEIFLLSTKLDALKTNEIKSLKSIEKYIYNSYRDGKFD